MTTNAAGKTTPRTPAQVLLESRQKDSREKRAAVEQQLVAMLTDGDPITYIKVARRAKVSTWLVYSPGTREQIKEAINKQQQPKQTPNSQPAGIDSLRTDLALARQEISTLRQEREDLRANLRQALGRQLNNLSTAPLVDRLNRLAGELAEARASNTELNLQITALQDDLAAARTSLRRMIREQNTDTLK
jgi:cell division protein FtsB